MARRSRKSQASLAKLSVTGFKSLRDKVDIKIRPLTLLAGANSSGKSSIIQPLLLLKQTLDASFDPGPLMLNGPNLKFTSANQILSRLGKSPERSSSSFSVGVELTDNFSLRTEFHRTAQGIRVKEWLIGIGNQIGRLTPNMSQEQVTEAIPNEIKNHFFSLFMDAETSKPSLAVRPDRCFFTISLSFSEGDSELMLPGFSPAASIVGVIRSLIHVPGLRGNPERNYPVSAIGPIFEGTFQQYVASVIAHWDRNNHDYKKRQLKADVESLGLTWKVEAKKLDDTRVELMVGRLPHASQGGAHDLVSVADVGFGVSQTLPVLVALIEADPGQIVYIEQPEIHLHPRAQAALANIIARASKRGVRVIIETHSSLLLVALQATVAEGELSGEDVILHWFTRDNETGQTQVSSTPLDESGAFGDWPEDFSEVAMQTEDRYLNAVEDV